MSGFVEAKDVKGKGRGVAFQGGNERQASGQIINVEKGAVVSHGPWGFDYAEGKISRRAVQTVSAS